MSARLHRFRIHAWGILLLVVAAMAARPVAAAYVIEPPIAREYLELKQRVLRQPADAALMFDYAVCLAYLGKIEASRAALRKVRELDPRFAERALPEYRERYHRDPTDARVAFRLGFLYYFDGQSEPALRTLGAVAERRPPGQMNAWALAYMAVIKGEQQQWAQAEELVRRALRLEPDAYALHAALAAALKAQGQLFAAVREYFIALQDRRDFEAYEKSLWHPDDTGARPAN
jgi:Flp pilus assembly protein TadD